MKFSLITVFSDFKNGLRGNVSAVVMLDKPIRDDAMQNLASDFNEPATTFLWKSEGEEAYHIRWYAPDAEIDLCGHGTMAATAFLSQGKPDEHFVFLYRQGIATGLTSGSGFCSIELDAIPVVKSLEIPQVLREGLGIEILEYYQTKGKYLVVVENEDAVRNMKPDFHALRKSEVFGYAVTAEGREVDFVSRTLIPHVQLLEDPATGSSHAALTPFWAGRLNKNQMISRQLSKRGGSFKCELLEKKVRLSGAYEVIGEGKLVLEL